MAYRVGVDIGGTFTDFCAFNEETNQLHTLKVLSTPDDPGSEVMAGVAELEARYGVLPGSIHYFTHGTTVGVNTVIQRKGVNLCLFTTENFVDVLEVARLKMPDPYSLHSKRPDPLISKDRVFPVRERMAADGSVDAPVERASVLDALTMAREKGAETRRGGCWDGGARRFVAALPWDTGDVRGERRETDGAAKDGLDI